ncbi:MULTISPECIES: hypothetical protein [unclassified Janthinobacterium]|uniref:hypothetical protein n=1 Tax=unclassified Janthinobacterium TaxID=2610881 RepID=UPI001619FCD7|nr:MULTISPECIES: hypothetical protein [unclassified Janthinobacterium]MBB5609807.1 hypothetical protein [Janthinobacterium sp. S3T4]MBB5615073.1 hypothetical protein [Janthinobacterium sp. S3M3]
MNNLRILYDNAADRAALTASSQAGTLGPAKLQHDGKSAVLRATGTAQTITATWPTQESISCVALIFTNMTSSARMRVRGYAQPGDTNPVLDTGNVFPCRAAVHGSFPWGVLPLGWNAYQAGGVNTWGRGGGADGVAWFAPVRVRKLVIDVWSPQSPEGYLEISRLVAGNYWSPEYNADYGAQLLLQDSSEDYRTAAGDLKTARGSTSDKLSINLSHLTPMDRARLMRILRENGKGKAMLFSLFPENADPLLEQDHMLYGKASNIDAVATPYFETYSAPLQIEGI